MDGRYRIDLNALEEAIEADRRAGLTPFLVVGTAGTVDTGAIDDLDALAGICRRERLWFHVDGAYGALAILAPDLAPRLKGIERADSLAFDFHKWGQVPYDAGFILVRDGVLHRQAFAASAPYLRRELRGLAAGAPWPCDYGPDLSRGFRALKTWFTLKVYGTDALGAVDFAHLRAGPLSGKPHRRNAGIGTAGAGGTQRGLLPLSRGGCPAHQSQDRDRTAGVRSWWRRPPPSSTGAWPFARPS